MDKDRSPLLDEIEKARKAELKKLGNIPASGCPLLAELDWVRAEEEATRLLDRIKNEEAE